MLYFYTFYDIMQYVKMCLLYIEEGKSKMTESYNSCGLFCLTVMWLQKYWVRFASTELHNRQYYGV